MAKIAMLGAGLIANFYADALIGKRNRDTIATVYSRTDARAQAFANKWHVPLATTSLDEAISSAVDLVVVALPNHQHLDAVCAAARAGKGVLCTKPLGRTADEAYAMLRAVEQAQVFHGYLEDLVYTPKTLKALAGTRAGSIGDVLWVRSRETHPGPHSDWFWNKTLAGGGAIVDMGCHCIEIARSFIGKDIQPVEAMCWGDTQVHPIETEDHAIGLVKYANGAIGQFEVSWAFRGGMDLRDEVAGTEGTIWLNHWLRTGFEMFSAAGVTGYVAEKSESDHGWQFPVGDETASLGYTEMFTDMLNSYDCGKTPIETFYDGYVVNTIIDACYKSIGSKRWEAIELNEWRGKPAEDHRQLGRDYDERHWLIKREILPDGMTRLILKEKATGTVVSRIE